MIKAGVIVGAHGVRGQVRIKSFLETPESLTAYGALRTADGRMIRLRLTGVSKGLVLAEVEGTTGRDAAEALKGTELYLPKEALPKLEEDSHYHGELIGLEVVDPSGNPLGRVTAVHNFGAGDILEVERPAGGSELYPFRREVVQAVDVPGGRLVLIPPEVI